jgi:N-acetylglutamate synthase-like GNAT family acetyltransferase
MKIRKANQEEMNDIYMMGFDVWSDGMTKESYIESCSTSAKYKEGTWWLILNEQDVVASSLIVYQFDEFIYGVGSIATPANMRSNGYASELLKQICFHLEQTLKATAIYLYSDIKPELYERCGFIKLDKSSQKYKYSICMLRSSTSPEPLTTPKYF